MSACSRAKLTAPLGGRLLQKLQRFDDLRSKQC